MQLLREHLDRARQRRNWRTYFALFLVFVAATVLLWILQDRLTGWANAQIDQRKPAMLNSLLRVLAWPPTPYIALFVLLIVAVAVLAKIARTERRNVVYSE